MRKKLNRLIDVTDNNGNQTQIREVSTQNYIEALSTGKLSTNENMCGNAEYFTLSGECLNKLFKKPKNQYEDINGVVLYTDV